MLKLNKYLILTFFVFTFVSCSEKKIKLSDEISFSEGVEGEIESPIDLDPHKEEMEFKKIYAQDFDSFDSFDLNSNWTLSDFNLQGEKDKELFSHNEVLGFDIKWTKRTRNLLADKLGYQRENMTHAFTNSLCPPKIEIGKEKAYINSRSENQIAELDTDLSHCSISGSEPATISMRSFVPTKVGYVYRVKLKYMMRSYKDQSHKSYKNLVLRFGDKLEKFDPVYESFETVKLEIVADREFSKLVIRDNGLPNSFGVLIDDIVIEEGDKSKLYDQCAQYFELKSKGFKKCIKGDVTTDNFCDLSNSSNAILKSSNMSHIASNRRDESNIFNMSLPQTGIYNFYSLGLGGKLNVSCGIDGVKALYPIYGKTLSLREVSWGNVSLTSYPELAIVRVKLVDCDDSSLNRVVTIDKIGTNEVLSYTFDENTEGESYVGCKMSKLIIKDITPSGPSTDGFDLNSLRFF